MAGPIREPGARGPLASYLTWLQAGRPNHHDDQVLNSQWRCPAQGRRVDAAKQGPHKGTL